MTRQRRSCNRLTVTGMAFILVTMQQPQSDHYSDSPAWNLLVEFLNLPSVRRGGAVDPAEQPQLARLTGRPVGPASTAQLESVRAAGAVLRSLLASSADEDQAAVALNGLLAAHPVRLQASPHGLRAEPMSAESSAAAVAVLLAATSLIEKGGWRRLRQCAGCDCVFYDTSRNGLRVWCSMEACGNRAKVSSWRHRARGESGCACGASCSCGARHKPSTRPAEDSE